MRSKRLLALSVALIAVGTLAASAAQAGVRGFKLEPMDPRVKVEGLVKMTTKGSLERLDLRVFSGAFRDGTMFTVSVVRADTDARRTTVAKIEIVMGSALLQLDNRKDVSAVFPFRGLREFYVSLPGYGDLAHGVVPGGV
jgi:hypothetical protein